MSDGSNEARKKLIEHNLRLVAHIVKKYASNFDEQDELISIGTIGLIKAVSTFDYKKGSKFATYASRCIENEILMHFRAAKRSASDIHMNGIFPFFLLFHSEYGIQYRTDRICISGSPFLSYRGNFRGRNKAALNVSEDRLVHLYLCRHQEIYAHRHR